MWALMSNVGCMVPYRSTLKEEPWIIRDLALVLSDWMDKDPQSQLKNLKRGNEWYLIKKEQIQSWDRIIKQKAVGAKLKMIWQRMPDDNRFGADGGFSLRF